MKHSGMSAANGWNFPCGQTKQSPPDTNFPSPQSAKIGAGAGVGLSVRIGGGVPEPLHQPMLRSGSAAPFPATGSGGSVSAGVGGNVGRGVGASVGGGVGIPVGISVGAGDGGAVGDGVGATVGDCVGAGVLGVGAEVVGFGLWTLRTLKSDTGTSGLKSTPTICRASASSCWLPYRSPTIALSGGASNRVGGMPALPSALPHHCSRRWLVH